MKRFTTLLLTCTLVLISACGTWDEAVAPAPALVGRYALRTIGGAALPVQVAGLSGFAYQSGSIQLYDNGTLVDVIRINGVVDSVFGTYTVSGETVSVTSNGLGNYTLRWDSHGALGATWAEGEYVYKRD